MRLVARLQILNHSSIHAKDDPVTSSSFLGGQICLPLLRCRLMSAICQVPLVCLPSSVTMWRYFSPRLDKLLPLAALYFCPLRLPTDSRTSTSGASEGGRINYTTCLTPRDACPHRRAPQSTDSETFKIFFLLPIPNSSCVVVGLQQGSCC